MPAQTPSDLIDQLCKIFYPDQTALGQFEAVPRHAVPEPYRQLLAHEHHMTVTLEAYHHCPVAVDVLSTCVRENDYARTSLLRRKTDLATVQFGIMRIDLSFLDEPLCREIQSQAVPLGRTLIRYAVMRRVELLSLYRIDSGHALRDLLARAANRVTYGRTARIHVDGVPAVDLLEIVTQADTRFAQGTATAQQAPRASE